MKSIRSWPGNRWLCLGARWYLGGVFLLACIHKIADPAAFALDVATYDIAPTALVNLVAICLPWVELAAALMLIVGVRVRPGALLVAAMMAIFTAALLAALARGLDMSCGCFASQGVEEDPISWLTVARDLVWLLMAVYVLAFDDRPVGIDSWLGQRRIGHA